MGNQLEQEEEAEQVVNEVSENQKQLEWITEMKISLVVMDNEERSKGKGFMKKVKERWDQRYSEYSLANWQKLRDNSARCNEFDFGQTKRGTTRGGDSK